MARYEDFRRLFYDKQELKRLYYLFGSERVLIEEIVDAVKSRVSASELDSDYIWADGDNSAEIWASLNQYPSEPKSRRLVIVRDSEKIKDWSHFLDWASSRLIPQTHVVFISNEHEADATLPHLDRIVRSGRFVDCSQLNKEDAVKWLKTKREDLPASLALYILDRVGDNLFDAQNVLKKASYFEGIVNEKIVDALTEKRPLEEFMENLIRQKKPEALRSIETVHFDEISQIIGQLDYRLDQVARLRSVMAKTHSTRDIMMTTKIPGFILKPMLDYQKFYSGSKVMDCQAVLAFVDEQWQSGVREGLLEALVALW